MSEVREAASERVLELRRQFDRGFIDPPAVDAERTEDFVAIHAGGEPHALRVAQIAGLYADVGITACPSPLPEMIGLAAFRSRLTAVYDLGLLLGLRAGAARWLVVALGGEVAYAFDSFDDHFRSSSAAHTAEQGASVIRNGELTLPLIDLAAVATGLSVRLRRTSQEKVT